MPATFFSTDATDESQLDALSFQLDNDAELTSSDLVELDVEEAEVANVGQSTNRRTTDLVRLYLQDIGRVRLL